MNSPARAWPRRRRRRARARHGVVAEVGQAQVAQQQAAVGVRVGAHAALAFGRQRGQFRDEPPVLVEQFLGPVALHPVFEQLQFSGLVASLPAAPGAREGPFDRLAVDTFGPVQPLGVRRTIMGQRGRS
jgi:hypothetical protein